MAARSPAGWRRQGSRWSGWMPARGSGRSRISPPTRPSRASCTGPTTGSRRVRTRSSSARTTAARRLAAALSISPWCRCGSARSGSGRAACWAMARTGRSTGGRCGRYYAEVEQALKIAGPVSYPWGPKRPRYPYRAHELNAAALALAEGCEKLGIAWSETPLATLSAPRGLAHPCVYRGFCVTGCSTNAKQSALVTWIPRAVAAGAEIRDLAMAGRIETDAERPRHRGALPSRRRVALPACPQRSCRRLRDRDAAVAAEFRDRPLSGWAGQQLRPGRPQSDRAGEPGGVGALTTRDPLVQGAAVAGIDRTLELRRPEGLLRRLLLHEPGSVAAALGEHPGQCTRSVGRAADGGDGELQPPGRPEDRRRNDAAGQQPGHASRREGPVRTADRARRIRLVRQRPEADRPFAGLHDPGPAGDRCHATSGGRPTTPAT